MLRLRTAISRVCRNLTLSRGGRVDAAQPFTIRMIEVSEALNNRQKAGLQTSLRQLHTICDLSQAEALNVAAQLENAGTVLIERDLSDAFESRITLSEDARKRFDSALARRDVQAAG